MFSSLLVLISMFFCVGPFGIVNAQIMFSCVTSFSVFCEQTMVNIIAAWSKWYTSGVWGGAIGQDNPDKYDEWYEVTVTVT